MSKIYIADDDKDIRRLLEIFLDSEGYEVTSFENGDDLYSEFLESEPDLVVLDIMMPGTDGLSICEKIRKKSSVPIIILTARDTDAEYIAGISLGSDDYLVKPFNSTVLSMKVKSLLRRVAMYEKEDGDVKRGDLTYIVKERSIYSGDVELKLTNKEFECLKYMMKHFNEAVSREDLLSNVWGYNSEFETRVTDETIRKIRKKLKLANSNVAISNKWGYGYILEEKDI